MSLSKLAEFDARAAAARTGQKRYLSTIPCIRDHLGERYTSSGNCIECLKRYKPVDVPKVNEAQTLFTLSVVMPSDVPMPDALRVYLVECMVAWYEANGPRVPFSDERLKIMRATGKPYGVGEWADMTPEQAASVR